VSIGPLEDALEVLGLDPEVVLVTAETAEGYASFLAQTADTEQLARAATMKVLAATCWCLVDPPRAPAVFAEASSWYADLGQPFAEVLSICAGERLLTGSDPSLGAAADELAYRALGVAWSLVSGSDDPHGDAAGLDALVAYGESQRPFPVGHLEVPVSFYLELASGVAEVLYGAEPVRALDPALARFLERGGEPVRMAIADEYHWTILATDVMPVEPELLAASRVAHRALGDWDDDTLSRLGIGEDLERLPLWIAQALDEPPGEPSWHTEPQRPLPPEGNQTLPTEVVEPAQSRGE
jgi:hypothetical protein